MVTPGRTSDPSRPKVRATSIAAARIASISSLPLRNTVRATTPTYTPSAWTSAPYTSSTVPTPDTSRNRPRQR